MIKSNYINDELKVELEDSLYDRLLPIPCRIEDAVNSLDKRQLRNLMYAFTKNYTNGWSVQDLRNTILHNIRDFIGKIFYFFTRDIYMLMKRILENNGVIENPNLDITNIIGLNTLGIIYPCMVYTNQLLVIPQEILDNFREINNDNYLELVNENTEVVNKAYAVLKCYGFMSSAKLYEYVYNEACHEGHKYDRFIELIDFANIYYGETLVYADGYRYKYFFNCRELLIEKKKLYHKLSFKMFDKSFWDELNNKEWLWNLSGIKELDLFMDKYCKSMRKNHYTEIERIWIELNNGTNLSDLCEMFIYEYLRGCGNEQIESFIVIMKNIYYSMPLWILKGYSYNELKEKNIACN